MIGLFLRYFHTLRPLKPSQVAFQLIRRLGKPSLPKRSGPAICRTGVSLKPFITRTAPLADEFAFRFLNEERGFSPEAIDWHPADAGKLWRYNLHYFDYLHQAGRTRDGIATLIDSWIGSNIPGTVDAWEPFPTSLRIVNWIKYFLSSGKEAKITGLWLDSLHDQTLWLEQAVEYHLLANHYLKNGKALIFAGLYFAGNDADRWLDTGVKIVRSQLAEQILPDGGHFERSPMYHSMILEDCIDLFNLCTKRHERGCVILAEQLREVIPRMLRFLLGMSHPDGDISLFNDAAFGIEPDPSHLAQYWSQLSGMHCTGPKGQAWSLPDSGYFVMAPDPDSRLIIDCGPMGPDYQLGHSHCDTLSFELSLGGSRVIVDSGCSQYTDSEIRKYNRGNAGHNTLTIDGRNQSEIWAAHRCARRARPLPASLARLPGGALHFCGAHDGYRRLPGKPVHRRQVTWSDKIIAITDEVEGNGCHDIELRLHINPELTVELVAGKAIIRRGDHLVATVSSAVLGQITITAGRYCPEFGRVHPAQVLVLSYAAIPLPFKGGWRIQLP